MFTEQHARELDSIVQQFVNTEPPVELLKQAHKEIFEKEVMSFASRSTHFPWPFFLEQTDNALFRIVTSFSAEKQFVAHEIKYSAHGPMTTADAVIECFLNGKWKLVGWLTWLYVPDQCIQARHDGLLKREKTLRTYQLHEENYLTRMNEAIEMDYQA